MADSSDSTLPCATLSPRQLIYSFFHTSGSRAGAGAKGLSDSQSLWSPTSPLDCRLFSNLSNPFSVKSSRPSLRSGRKKHLGCSNVGLGIINSLVNETKPNGEILGIFERKSIIFGPQVKTDILKFSKNSQVSLEFYLKSNSLPKNYTMSLPPETKISKSEVVCFDDVSKCKELNCKSKAFKSIFTSLPDSTRPSSLLINSNQNTNFGINDLCAENASTVVSLPPVTGRSLELDHSLKTKSCSLPISIDFSNGYLGSLSAKEIELSEDYTCIISHGPNPKRTHIFGDCILECHRNDLTQFTKKEELASFRSSQVPIFSEGSTPYPSDSILSFCYSCKKKLEEGEDIYIYRGEKAFCSFNCRSENISAEEELEKTYTNSEESSPDSSYQDLFLMGVLVAK